MLSCGTPTSTVAMPSRVAVSGPMVVPHGMLLRLTKTCQGTPASSKIRSASAAVAADVAYRWLWFNLIAGPWFTIGRCAASWRSG